MELVAFCRKTRRPTDAELDVVRRFDRMALDLAYVRLLGARVLECFEHRQPREAALRRTVTAIRAVLDLTWDTRCVQRDLRARLDGWRLVGWDAQPPPARHVGPLRLNSLHGNGHTARDLAVLRSFFDEYTAWSARYADETGPSMRGVARRCLAACGRGLEGLDHCHPTLADAQPARPRSPPDPADVAQAIDDAVASGTDADVAAAAWLQLRDDVRCARGPPGWPIPTIPCVWEEAEAVWVGLLHGDGGTAALMARAAVLRDARMSPAKRTLRYVSGVLLPAYAKASLAALPGFVPDMVRVV